MILILITVLLRATGPPIDYTTTTMTTVFLPAGALLLMLMLIWVWIVHPGEGARLMHVWLWGHHCRLLQTSHMLPGNLVCILLLGHPDWRLLLLTMILETSHWKLLLIGTIRELRLLSCGKIRWCTALTQALMRLWLRIIDRLEVTWLRRLSLLLMIPVRLVVLVVILALLRHGCFLLLIILIWCWVETLACQSHLGIDLFCCRFSRLRC